jgi:hypothetical protein
MLEIYIMRAIFEASNAANTLYKLLRITCVCRINVDECVKPFLIKINARCYCARVN